MIKQLFFGWLLVMVTGSMSATPSGLTTHGSLQFDASGWYRESDGIDSALSFAGMNMLTLNVKTPLLKTAKVEGLIDVYQVYGEYAGLVQGTSDSPALSLFSGRTPILADLRMLYGALYLPWADITLGRQIVNYGKGTLFSPLDVFSSVNLLELSFKRSGSDIAMAAFPVGDLSGIDVVTEFPAGTGDYASLLRGFTTLGGWDLSAVGIYRHRSREGIGGVAFKGDLLVGVTGEVAARYRRDSGDVSVEAMAGVDYSVKNTWFFSAEYNYRGRDNGHPMYGTHNLFGSVQYIINDLMTASLVVVGVLPEENVLATVQYSWNILQSVSTVLYLRYYKFENFGSLLPQGEAGTRVTISF
jgi:hypothetical protein